LKKRFPRVRRAVIIQGWVSISPRRYKNTHIPRCLQVLVEACPPDIDVSAFILEDKFFIRAAP
jgi:hypothetical protein